VEPEGSLMCSQEPAIWSCLEAAEASQRLHTQILEISFEIIFLSSPKRISERNVPSPLLCLEQCFPPDFYHHVIS
jgi:hypothetical protein